MFRKIFGLLTALVAALLLVGTAWALGDQPGDTSTTTTVEEQSTLSQPSSSTTADDSTFTDVTTAEMEANESTTTTLDDDDQGGEGPIDDSARIDDDDHQGSDDDHHTTTTMDDDQVSIDLNIPATSYQADGAGVVQLQVTAGVLSVVGITLSDGWTYEVKGNNDHELKVKFGDGSTEVEFEAEIEHSQIVVDVSSEMDD
ncbi:MAG: hypothetical protein WB245_06725 [Acidimicrobiia bacterium]